MGIEGSGIVDVSGDFEDIEERVANLALKKEREEKAKQEMIEKKKEEERSEMEKRFSTPH